MKFLEEVKKKNEIFLVILQGESLGRKTSVWHTCGKKGPIGGWMPLGKFLEAMGFFREARQIFRKLHHKDEMLQEIADLLQKKVVFLELKSLDGAEGVDIEFWITTRTVSQITVYPRES